MSPREIETATDLDAEQSLRLAAVFELDRRRRMESLPEYIRSPEDAACAFRPYIGNREHERLAAVYLDEDRRVLAPPHVLSQGNTVGTDCDPATIIGGGVRRGAAGFVLAHNHPSGVLDPSPQDLTVTSRLQRASLACGMEFHDHVILGRGMFHKSLREERPQLWSGPAA